MAPAPDVLAAFLISQNVASSPIAGVTVEALPWPAYVGFMNDEGPDNAVHLFGMDNRTDGVLQRTGEIIEHDNVLMLLRSIDYPTGRDKIAALDTLITQTRRVAVTVNGVHYLLQSSIRKTSVIHAWQEPKNRREVFRAKYILSIKGA